MRAPAPPVAPRVTALPPVEERVARSAARPRPARSAGVRSGFPAPEPGRRVPARAGPVRCRERVRLALREPPAGAAG
ncbi:hypothetical protein DEF28_13555 [Marinitenerispora sediminis]|nr:hypothetical protein DEF28_13555 [Marinitenerispora sediminis]